MKKPANHYLIICVSTFMKPKLSGSRFTVPGLVSKGPLMIEVHPKRAEV